MPMTNDQTRSPCHNTPDDQMMPDSFYINMILDSRAIKVYFVLKMLSSTRILFQLSRAHGHGYDKTFFAPSGAQGNPIFICSSGSSSFYQLSELTSSERRSLKYFALFLRKIVEVALAADGCGSGNIQLKLSHEKSVNLCTPPPIYPLRGKK